ncbi:variant erythrocyte surface antigen-1 family protein [Babesia divergens]|uniref:Variant erythrocyte surface antigen-1 family protein n=1 Tax=Babesia divergens TaxID=32595 RepID=A0AAD9LDY2_BABDI|nr:variant erythrocyte surface antigen-1 family protein [Babesia divergens]
MEICSCTENCCDNGKCTKGSLNCPVCINLKTPKDYTVTGLGLLRPSPKRLAEKLENFFGDSGQKSGCGCQCGTSGQSCCCLACQSCSSQHCSCSTSQCSCASKLKLQPSQCPCKDFCIKINSIKVTAQTSLMKCCNQGAKCHCQLQKSSPCSSNCCVTQLNGSKKQNFNHQSIKCMLRRLVSYFKSLETSSKNFFKSCCDLLCVVKMCHFLGDFYGKRNKDVCWRCKDGSGGISCNASSKGQCCAGSNPKCSSGSTCQNCSECQQICYAKEFSRALEALKYSSPCGHDLYRTLDDFLNFCCKVFYPRVKDIQGALEAEHAKKCQCTPGSCQCSSGSPSCLGCAQVLEKLQDHKDVLSLMTHGYSSAYSSEASWASLTSSSNSGPCCGSSSPSCSQCSPSGCSSSGSPCDPSQCCPDCPQRKAAKIFLGMLPCLFHALQYLYKQCKKEQQDGGWKNLNIKDNSSLTSLGAFLVGMGYAEKDLEPSAGASKIFSSLSSLINNGSGPLDKIYKEVKEKYFTSFSPSPVPSSDSDSKPKTVRDILLWLSGLPFTSGFKDLLKHCESLCDSVNPVQFNNFESSLYASCLRSPFVLATIQWPGKSEIFYHNFSEISKFFYPEDPFKLFETFCDFVRKIYIALNFLCIQCKNDSGQGGWKDCYFGKDCSVKPLPSASSVASTSGCSCSSSDPSNQGYLCTASDTPDVHGKHCDPNGGGKGCINAKGGPCSDPGHNNSKSNCKPCPHPLLKFLIDDPSCPFKLPFSFAQLDFSQSPPTILEASSDKEIFKMGFKTEQLPTPGRHGRDLYDVLNSFCGSGTSPLTKLFEFSLFVAMRPPETLIELYAFFVKFRFKLKSEPELSSKFIDWINGEPGTPDGSALKTAIEKLYDFSGHRGSHPADLHSLFGCSGPKGSSGSPPTCGRYLHPLYNVAGVFSEKFCGLYLSYVCHLAGTLKALLEKFKKDFSKSCPHCSSGKCQKIVECPCALPFLYTYGFTFFSPGNLNCPGHDQHKGQDQNCTRKTCKDFIAQLGKVISGEPFKALLDAIDAFLWSIRLPFFLFLLLFWCVIVQYFVYVHLVKLDTFHTGSHLYLPRSFKILPSTLFSDASSKLKDLSYFTL